MNAFNKLQILPKPQWLIISLYYKSLSIRTFFCVYYSLLLFSESLIFTLLFPRSLLPRIRRLIDHNYAITTVVYILITATRRSDVLSDNALPLATLIAPHNDCRMEKSRIGYLLRQKVIEVETETQEANDAMIVAVNWLNRLSIHFEEFCQRIDPELHFSPKPFNHPVLVSHCTIGSEKLTHKC